MMWRSMVLNSATSDARQHLQVDVGQLGQLDLPHVGDDELGAARYGPLDQGTEDRMRLGGVGAGDEDDVAGFLDLPHRPRRRGGVQGAVHSRHRGRVAEPGAVVHAVGSESGPDHSHEGVVVFVAALGRREGSQRLRAMLVANAEDLLGRQAQRLVPGGLPKGAVPAGRSRHPVADVVLVDQV